MTVPGAGDGKAVVELFLKYNSTKSRMALEEAAKDSKRLNSEQQANDSTLKGLDRDLALLNKMGKSYAAAYKLRAQEAKKATAEVVKAEKKLATEQRRIEKEEVKARKEAEKEYVESYRRQLQAKLEATKKKPREQEDVLRAAGMSEAGIKAAKTFLDRAGGSVAGLTKALQRMNIPADKARAIATAMKEAANEARVLQSETNKAFFFWRRISEQGVRLAEVGFILGAGGAAILAPLTLAATQYTERFRSLEDEAARFTAVQNEQKEAMSDLGREASVALMPVMELLLSVLKQIVQVVKDNPDLLGNIVKGGGFLAALGTAMVLFGRVESVIGRLMVLFATRAPGSIPIPGLTHLTGGAEGGIGLTQLGGTVARGGIFAAAIAAGTLLGGALLRLAQNAGVLGDEFDTTGDGVIDFYDSIKTLRTFFADAVLRIVDGFFKVAIALVNFTENISTLPERLKNSIANKGFITDADAARIGRLEETRGARQDQLAAAQERLASGGATTPALRLEQATLNDRITATEDRIEQNLRLMEGAGPELSETLGAITDELQKELDSMRIRFRAVSNELFARQTGVVDGETPADRVKRLTDELAALDETIRQAREGAFTSEKGQDLEAERQRILREMAPSLIDFVETGTIGGGAGAGTGGASGVAGIAAQIRAAVNKAGQITPEELALFGAFRQSEISAERQYQQQLSDLARQRRLQELEAEREYNRNLEQMRREQARKERDMLEDHALDVQQAQIEFARKEADIERKRQFDRLQKLREHELRLTELAAARDVAGFVEAQKRFALEQKQEEKQAGFDKAQRQKEFDLERADKEREFQLQLMQSRRAFDEQLEDAKRNFDVQKAERQRQYDEQLTQMRTEQDRQRQERLRAFAQELDDLKVSQGTLTEERKAYNEEIKKGYTELLAAHSDELKRALQQAYGLTGARGTGFQTPVTTGNRSVTIPSSTLRLTRYQTGTRYVPRDQIAHLDAGERVLTPSQNRAYGPMLDRMDRGGMWPTANRTTIVNITGNAFGRVASMDDVHELGMEIVRGMEESGAML